MFNKILFPVDGSGASKKALEYVLNISRKYSAEVVVLNVFEPIGDTEMRIGSGFTYLHEIEQHQRERSNTVLNETEVKLKEKGAIVKTISVGGISGLSIVNVSEKEKCDLIVIGRRSLGAVKSVLLGSVSNYVVHHATCPVLLISGE